MPNKEQTAVVLMSGGMDSALCAAKAKESGYEIAALHINYGQTTQAKEAECFSKLADFYSARHKLILDINHLRLIGGSALTDPSIALGPGESGSVPTSYVPFRNANLLAMATSWAEVLGASAIFIGAMQLDYSGYPDCRDEFFAAFEKAIETGTKPETEIKIITPIINYTKSDVVRDGLRLGVPFGLTWSCYSSEGEACGECDSCRIRLRGFEQAGATDPIPYRKISRII